MVAMAWKRLTELRTCTRAVHFVFSKAENKTRNLNWKSDGTASEQTVLTVLNHTEWNRCVFSRIISWRMENAYFPDSDLRFAEASRGERTRDWGALSAWSRRDDAYDKKNRFWAFWRVLQEAPRQWYSSFPRDIRNIFFFFHDQPRRLDLTWRRLLFGWDCSAQLF